MFWQPFNYLSLLLLDLTLHCLVYQTTQNTLVLGLISLYVVSANHLLTLIAVLALSLDFSELISFSIFLYTSAKFCGIQSVSSFVDKQLIS